MKAKKGQILVITLTVMALGLIIISPLLSFLNSSYNLYIKEAKKTESYYAADAMMTRIMHDIYRGVDVYNQDISSPYSQDNYLGGNCNISVVIEETITSPLPTPSAGGDWIYMDPGVSSCPNTSCNSNLLLESLAYGQTHDFTLYLVGGHEIQVNWAMDDEGARFCFIACCGTPCAYYPSGAMWMTYSNGSTIPGTYVSGTNTSQMLRLALNWSVPAGASGNYTVKFQNNGCYRQSSQDIFCGCSGTENRPSYSASFAAADDRDHTWVRLGSEEGGVIYSYKDYFITATAEWGGQDVLSITAYVRHSPGPLAWWKEQTVEVPTWQVIYY